jgi:hypothetical protein
MQYLPLCCFTDITAKSENRIKDALLNKKSEPTIKVFAKAGLDNGTSTVRKHQQWFGHECVTNEGDENSFQCCIRDEGLAAHIRLAGGVYKLLHGAVIKSYGIER